MFRLAVPPTAPMVCGRRRTTPSPSASPARPEVGRMTAASRRHFRRATCPTMEDDDGFYGHPARSDDNERRRAHKFDDIANLPAAIVPVVGDRRGHYGRSRSSPTTTVASGCTAPSRTCAAFKPDDRHRSVGEARRAVHLIAEVSHGINPRSDTFRRNLRRPDEPCDAEKYGRGICSPETGRRLLDRLRPGRPTMSTTTTTGAVWSDDRSATVPRRTNR